MTPRKLAEVALAMLVILLVLACLIWPVLPYVIGWFVLFEGWRFSAEMDFWHAAWRFVAVLTMK
jgi:hypothetical protein